MVVRTLAGPEQLMDDSDVVAIVQEMRGQGVTEGVAGCALGDARCTNHTRHGTFQRGLVEVMPVPISGCDGHVGERKRVN